MKITYGSNSLAQRLTKRFAKLGLEMVKQRAAELMPELHKIARDWKNEVRKILSTPSISRGYSENGMLNPHNSFSYNRGFPMMTTGKLRDSLQYRVQKRNIKDGISISFYKKFNHVDNGRGGDYGEILNKRHRVLRGWKERAFAMVDTKIIKLLKQKGFR